MELVKTWTVIGLPQKLYVIQAFNECPFNSKLLIIKLDFCVVIAVKRSFVEVANKVGVHLYNAHTNFEQRRESDDATVRAFHDEYFGRYNDKTTEIEDWHVFTVENLNAKGVLEAVKGWFVRVETKLETQSQLDVEVYA